MRNQSEEHNARTYSQCTKKTMDKGKVTFEKGLKNNGKERNTQKKSGEKEKKKEKRKKKKKGSQRLKKKKKKIKNQIGSECTRL